MRLVIALAVIGVLFGVGAGVWYFTRSDSSAITEDRREQPRNEAVERTRHRQEAAANATTAANLSGQYRANEVAADDRFRGRWVHVTGVVRRVAKDNAGLPVLVFEGDVQCFFAVERTDDVRALKPGESITVIGRGAGLNKGPQLVDCETVGRE
jgi:hypothetical protein